jgi:hypothetical protein
VAKSVARQLATAVLWVRIQTSLKNHKWATLAKEWPTHSSPPKQIYKKNNHMIFTRDMKCFAGRQICRGPSVREGFARARGIREETGGEEGGRRKEMVAVLGRPDSTSSILNNLYLKNTFDIVLGFFACTVHPDGT